MWVAAAGRASGVALPSAAIVFVGLQGQRGAVCRCASINPPDAPSPQETAAPLPQRVASAGAAAVLAASLALGGAPGPAAASEFDLLVEPKPTTSYYVDDASALSLSTKSDLNKKLKKLEVGGGGAGGRGPVGGEEGIGMCVGRALAGEEECPPPITWGQQRTGLAHWHWPHPGWLRCARLCAGASRPTHACTPARTHAACHPS